MKSKSPSVSASLCGQTLDIVIIGAGIGGAAAASLLGRSGFSVALIDRYERYPAEFRAEKISGSQIDLLKRLGLFDAVTGKATSYSEIIKMRGGLIEHVSLQEYGLAYQAMVGAVRSTIPLDVNFIVGFVTRVETGDDSQTIYLSDGRIVTARLIILATGLNGKVVEDLGIGYRLAHKCHTLCIGFTLAPVAKPAFDFTSLTLHGADTKDKIDYISLFPLSGAMRANIFSYHHLNDDWTLKMRDAPRETLLATMPQLKKFLGDFEIVEKPKFRAIDLRFAKNFRRSGIVLIGDAFQTSCPSAGTGLSRALTDVDRLCNIYVPRWLRTSGMGAAKISQFYDDALKRDSDARADHLAQYHRAIAIDTSVSWILRRRLIKTARGIRAISFRLAEMTSRLNS